MRLAYKPELKFMKHESFTSEGLSYLIGFNKAWHGMAWSLKAQLNQKHADMFPLNQSTVNTRHRKKFKEYYCHTAKYYKSAIPSMTRSLNEYFARQISSTPE